MARPTEQQVLPTSVMLQVLSALTAPSNDPPLANLAAWFRSDAAYKDVGLTQKATITGDPVLGMKDKAAGNLHNATYANSDLTLQTSVISGLDVVASAVTGYSLLDMNANVVLPGPLTVYAVGQFTGHGTDSRSWQPLAGGAGYFGYLKRNFALGQDIAVIGVDSGAYAYQYDSAGAGSVIARWRRDNGNATFFAATGSAEVPLVPAGPAGTLTLGRLIGGTVPTAGNFAELLVYSEDTVASGQDSAVLNYLNVRYGLTLP